MRFVIAAFAAFLVLMLDLDGTPIPATLRDTPAVTNTKTDDAFSATFALFEKAEASAQPDPVVRDAEPSSEASSPPAPSPALAPTPAKPEQSTVDVFCQALRRAAETSEIPVAFFARLIWQESRFRANEVSHAGAQGVAQFMPETAAEVGLDDPFDPLKALPASARLLRKLRDDFGNLGLAAAAYNAGSGRIQKWLSRQSELPRETRDYVRIITGTKPEDWIEDADLLAIRVDLPSDAPCEGTGGLSKSRDVAFVSASPAPAIATIIRKAEAAELAARIAVNRTRKRLALLLRKSAPSAGATRLGKARHAIAARATKGVRGHAIRLAARERSST